MILMSRYIAIMSICWYITLLLLFFLQKQKILDAQKQELSVQVTSLTEQVDKLQQELDTEKNVTMSLSIYRYNTRYLPVLSLLRFLDLTCPLLTDVDQFSDLC